MVLTVPSPTPYQSSILEKLGFSADDRVVIFHADDVGMCHGANAAFFELSAIGAVDCCAVMVCCPWFREVAERAQADPTFDIGVHLTLTSEWATYRWGPISTADKSSGLIDPDGYFWRRLPGVAENVVPEAAEKEFRAQIERALDAGIDVTHLDTHMGVALLPQLVEIYVRLGREYRLPVLVPTHINEYTSIFDPGQFDDEGLSRVIAELQSQGVPLVERFLLTPGVPTEESDAVYREMIDALPPGLTMFAIHPNMSGDIETIVPPRAHYRTDEHRIFSDPFFREHIAGQGVKTIGFRALRDLYRGEAK